MSIPETGRLASLIAERRQAVEAALADLPLPAEPSLLYDPVRYVLSGGGKRLRPVLLLLVADAYGVPAGRAMPAALAAELFHNFTLVHDDIMDRAETRRGRSAVHRKWDVGTALLSGDYLLALSYEMLSTLDTARLPDILQVYHRMVQLLCEGQAMDKAFESSKAVSVAEYYDMIDRKTGALLAAVFQIAGLLGDAPPADVARLGELGRSVGRAFQIQDDLLDLVADDPKWGKKTGGDLIEGKKAYLLLRALEMVRGEDRRFFARIVDEGGLAPDAVPQARALMERHGVLADARRAVLEHTAVAMNTLDVLPAAPSTEALRALILQLQERIH